MVRAGGKRVALNWAETYHLSIRLPRIQFTISDRSHTISCDGSYPLVAFPMPHDCQYRNTMPLYSVVVSDQPSASVVPLTSTTCTRASACLRSSRNLFPNPFPSCAPGTNPATSRSSMGTDRFPSTQEP